MTYSPRFQAQRRADVRDVAASAPFSYVGKQLRLLVSEMVAAASLAAGSRVLDYGCADTPYRSEMPPGVRCVGADLAGNTSAEIELRADGTVPVADGSFELVISTQVLEHVVDPDRYLSECFRVLRPGGSLVLSTHGIMYYHRDPEDYWRWMRPGLRLVIERQGFVIEEMRGILGLAAAAMQIFQDATYWRIPKMLKRSYVFVMQRLIALTDSFYSKESRLDNALVIAARATKPRE